MLEIVNLTKKKISRKFFDKVFKKSYQLIRRKKISPLSLVLVEPEKIKKINRLYRHKNMPTDVLSFEELNEIFICPDFVAAQAKKVFSSFDRELSRVFIHGILHLEGYDHEKGKKEAEGMWRLEERILKNLFS